MCKMRAWQITPVLGTIALVLQCGSLTGELNKIRLHYEDGLAAANVTGTVPADGTVSAPVQSYADVIFDRDIDAASLSFNATSGACTGSVMVSADNFATCMGITVTATGNTIRLGSTSGANGSVPRGVTLKIRISGVAGKNGVPANFYESAQGISFASPCGQNCFYSDSAPLSAPVATGSHSFVIPGGAKAGSVITLTGGGSATSTIYNPSTNQTAVGPAACCNINAGSHSFYVATAGGVNSGNFITVCGGSTANVCAYDNSTNTFTAVAGGFPSAPYPSAGSLTIPILTGGSAGNYLTLAGGSTAAFVYNVATNNYVASGSTISGGTAIGPASSWIRLDTGGNSGKPFIVVGNGNSNTNLFTDAGLAFASSAATISPINGGSFSFRVNAGTHANRVVVAHGILNSSTAFDQTTMGSFSGPIFPCTPSNGALAATLTSGIKSGQTLVLCAGSTANYALYDHGLNSFSPLRTTTGVLGANSSLSLLTSGTNAGQYFIVNGSATGNTTIYDPAQDSVVGTRLYRATGSGSNGFAVKSGPKQGRVLIMTGGLPATSLYNPQTGQMEPGPDLGSSIGTGALNFPITSGPNAGMQYVLQGGGTSIVHKYDPATNSFAIASGAGIDYSGTVAAKNTGSRHFLIPSGPQTNNYLILNGGVMTTADYFDTTTNTFATAGSITGCATGVSAGSWVFRVSSGGQSGKFMIICGGVNNTALFDPAGPSFAAGPTLGATASLGAHGFYITTGANAGKYLFILASANATRLYDPSLNAWGAGPTLCGTAGGGGFNLPITAGIQAGKQLIVLGGGTTSTCFYDPGTHTFSAGPGTGTHQGYAVGTDSLAFTLGYGVFPSAYVIIHGAQSTTFSHWFAY